MDPPREEPLLDVTRNHANQVMLSNYDRVIDFIEDGKLDKKNYWLDEYSKMQNGIFSPEERDNLSLALDKKILQLSRLQNRLMKNLNEIRSIKDIYVYSKLETHDALTLVADCRRGIFLSLESDFICKEIQHALSLRKEK